MTATVTTAARWAATGMWWYVRELTGELTGRRAWERYLERQRVQDPGAEPLSRREFERRRTDARLADPRNGYRGCC